MATSLAQQLLKLKVPESQTGAKRVIPSLLFDPKVAAAFDKDRFFDIGTNGFQELCKLDATLHNLYFEQLFSEAAADTERSVKSREFNLKLDATIDSFLLQLSPYFLLRPAQKCIEWLLHRFHIHAYNSESIFKCIFPYFGTNLFVRAFQLFEGKHIADKWKAVAQMLEDGTPLSRKDVILLCLSDTLVLEFLCDVIIQCVKMNGAGNCQWRMQGWTNLFTSVILGAISKSNNINETFLHHLMPALAKGLMSDILDFQASCFMIISQLMVKATLNVDSLDMIIRLTTKYCLPSLQKEALLMVASLFHLQRHYKKLQKGAFRRLTSWDSFFSSFVTLCSSAIGNRFAEIFLDRLVPPAFIVLGSDACSSGESDSDFHPPKEKYQHLLRSIVIETNLSRRVQDYLLQLVLQNFGKHAGQTNDVMNEILNRIEKKYPEAFDQAVLITTQSTKLSDKVLQKFLTVSLASLKHQLLEDSRMTLIFAISHPESSIRLQAINMLNTLLKTENCSEASKSFAVDSLSNILARDDDPVIIEATLSLLRTHILLISDSEKKIFEQTLKMLQNKWDVEEFTTVVLKGIEFLIYYCSTFSAEIFNDKQALLKNKTILLVFQFVLKQTLVGWHGKTSNVAIGTFLKDNFLLNEIWLYSGNDFEELTKKLCKSMSENHNQVLVLSLYDTLHFCEDRAFFMPLLLFMIHVGLKSRNEKIFFKAIYLFIEINKVVFSCGCIDSLQSFSVSNVVFEMIKDPNCEAKQQLICQAFLLLWKEAMLQLPFFVTLSSDQLFETNLSDDCNKSAIVKDVFFSLLDLTNYSASKEVSKSIQEIVFIFMNQMFVSFSEVMSFLSVLWYQLLCDEWSNVTESSKHFIASCCLALSLVSRKERKSVDFQSDFKLATSGPLLIPSLFLSCTSIHKQVRHFSVQVLRCLAKFENCPCSSFLKHFSSYSKEIHMDQNQASEIFAEYFSVEGSRKKGKKTKELIQLLSDYVIDQLHSSHYHLCSNFYKKCFVGVENSFEFEVIIPCLENLLGNGIKFDHVSFQDKCSLINLWLQKVAQCCDPRRDALYLKALQIEPDLMHSCSTTSDTPLVALELLNGKLFASVCPEMRSQVLDVLVSIKANSKNQQIQSAASKAFKSITIPHSLVLDELKQLGMLSKPMSEQNVIQAKRAKLQKEASIIQGKKLLVWREFVVFLELLHHKKRIKNSQNLIAPFFDLLNDIHEQKFVADNVEYVTLLVLGCLLNFFDRAKGLDGNIFPQIKANVNIELLVRCIHSTQNSQTHQHALLLLAKTVQFCPEKVLHSIMSIFTFMGSTILRRDDSYSFQIISQTIRTIIPSLIQMEKKHSVSSAAKFDAVVGILRVFVDSLPHIPAHRRLIVFKELLDELDPTVFLWQLVVLFVEQRVTKLSRTSKDDAFEDHHSHEDAAFQIEESVLMWTQICELFSVQLRIKVVIDILSFLQIFISSNDCKPTCSDAKSFLDPTKYSPNQVRRFHVFMLTFIAHIIRNIKSNSKEQVCAEDLGLERLLESGLIYLDHVHQLSEIAEGKSNVEIRYQKAMMHQVNDILEKMNFLISQDIFLELLYKLLGEKSIAERGFVLQKLIQLFHRRVGHSGVKFTKEQEHGLLKLAERFSAMLGQSSISASEKEVFLHTAALGLTYIIRLTCQKNPKAFVATQSVICDVIETQLLSNNVLSSLLACLGEIIINLKAHSIGNLKRLCSCMLKLLVAQQTHQSSSVYVSLLTTINKLFSCLGHFLSPYVEQFIVKLSLLQYSKLQSTSKQPCSTNESTTKPSQKRHKPIQNSTSPSHQLVANVLHLIVDKVAPRVWIPVIQSSYNNVKSEQVLAVKCLLSMAVQNVKKLSNEDLFQHANKLIDFYLHAMNFRNDNAQMTAKEIDSIESESLDGVISFLIKLPETNFRPLFLKVYGWGCGDNVTLSQCITFYRCTSLMAKKLKGLFEIFASDLIDDICDELKKSPTKLVANEHEIIKKQTYVLDTLSSMLNYSSANLLNQELFESILHPLLNQLEIVLSDQSRSDVYVTKHVTKCIGYLAAAASRDNLSWRPLNYEILMKTRHDSPTVRCYALESLKVCVENMSEHYLVQLPETIPFLAELLEDESNAVETCCQRVIKRMEEVLGESLQKYF